MPGEKIYTYKMGVHNIIFWNFSSFSFQSLSQEIIRRTQQTRTSVKDDCLKKSAADKSNASMQKAQDLAKNILNLSQSDLDEIMSAEGDSTKVVRFLTLEAPITTNVVFLSSAEMFISIFVPFPPPPPTPLIFKYPMKMK